MSISPFPGVGTGWDLLIWTVPLGDGPVGGIIAAVWVWGGVILIVGFGFWGGIGLSKVDGLVKLGLCVCKVPL